MSEYDEYLDIAERAWEARRRRADMLALVAGGIAFGLGVAAIVMILMVV